jgi:hypothetical protein
MAGNCQHAERRPELVHGERPSVPALVRSHPRPNVPGRLLCGGRASKCFYQFSTYPNNCPYLEDSQWVAVLLPVLQVNMAYPFCVYFGNDASSSKARDGPTVGGRDFRK